MFGGRFCQESSTDSSNCLQLAQKHLVSNKRDPMSRVFCMGPNVPSCQGAGNLLRKIASTRNSKTNVNRNLRLCIHKAGVSLDITMDLVKTTIRLNKPTTRVEEVWWPCFSMTSWIEVLMARFPQFLLGGHHLHHERQWRQVLGFFWNQYKICDPAHPIFQEQHIDFTSVIPYLVHGDEGRGLRSSAFMVQAWQTVVSHKGILHTNQSGRPGLINGSVSPPYHS